MSHYFDSGFCVRKPSWHRQENLLADYPENWDEARMAAGLMWEPKLVPAYRLTMVTREATHAEVAESIIDTNTTVYRGTDGRWLIDVPSYVEGTSRYVVRDDTQAEIGTVSDGFALINHGEMGQIIEAVLGQTNVKFETAGSVKGGAMVWALVKIDEPYTVAGDVDASGDPILTFPYLALLNSHDGTGACKLTRTQVRVVCWNTIQAADADGDNHGQQFKFRHTGKPMERIEDAKEALAGARDEATRWRAVAEELYGHPADEEFKLRFVSEFIPTPPAGVVSDRVMANVRKDQAHFMHLLSQPTNDMQAHTALGVFNASIEFLDHVRGFRNTDTYLGRTVLKAEPMKAKSLKLIRTLVGAGVN